MAQLLSLLLREQPDLPGAVRLASASRWPDRLPVPAQALALPAGPAARLTAFDTRAEQAARTLPADASAGGEQAKFLTSDAMGQHWLVEFSPPRGTPFGERWHDLLLAEALAVVGDHGVPVAAAQVLYSARRSYLASRRFDRIGARGAAHVLPLDAVHDAFVPLPRQHWPATVDALVRQRRLPAEAAPQVRAHWHFGRLIGNSDMLFGNLSLVVASPADAARGRFSLAPVCDMLPMRWRPDAQTGALDWLTFTPDPADLASTAQPVAPQFWQRAASLAAASAGWRALASEMGRRLAI